MTQPLKAEFGLICGKGIRIKYLKKRKRERKIRLCCIRNYMMVKYRQIRNYMKLPLKKGGRGWKGAGRRGKLLPSCWLPSLISLEKRPIFAKSKNSE